MARRLQAAVLGPLLARLVHSEIAKGVKASLLLRIAGAVLSLTVSIVLARLLGAEGFGIYAYCLAIVSLLAIPSQFGAGTVLIRFVAAYEHQRQWALLQGVLRWANHFVLISSVLLAAITAIIFTVFPRLMPAEATSTLWIALLLLPILSLGELRAAALRGFRQFVKGQLPEMILRPGALLLIVLLIAASSHSLGPREAMLGYFIASIIAFAFGMWWLWRAVPAQSWAFRPQHAAREWAKAMTILSATRGGRVALNRMDVVFVGAIAGAEAAGLYRVATVLAGLIGIVLSAINTVVGPYFSRLHVDGKPDRMRHLLLSTSIAAGSFALSLAFVMILWGEKIILWIYGAEFSLAYAPLTVLALGQLFNAATGPVGTFANMTGQEGWALIAVITTLTISVPSYMYLIPQTGLIGAATVMSGGFIMLNSILCIRLWTTTHPLVKTSS